MGMGSSCILRSGSWRVSKLIQRAMDAREFRVAEKDVNSGVSTSKDDTRPIRQKQNKVEMGQAQGRVQAKGRSLAGKKMWLALLH